ncbi:uncharacterized protein CcaverHIS019_0112020 [Cutaneotrichosporon cavernicola]|uniref:alpha-amylase n=1 Tax=Cutaneotrichosporon cavernicola TaxID=279322 RepID=A0AA48I2Q4_9TREE|nr:uncharacterized protein CcaverHIS019_0112020 [Cutaneotrichosporon cavernicola]BEI88484.1 hypothetical protein CcaverHIS019_0112020 [Cutaneotrichosporon cavernicola]
MIWVAATLLLLFTPAAALTTRQLRERSIYQVITDRFERPDGAVVDCDPAERRYCGGGWKGIQRQLAYIQGMGFDTVWISPVVANIDGIPGSESYHGYWASNMFELNERFGSPQDLLDLSNALHARGMFLMVDVAINHVGSVPDQFVVGEQYGPFNKAEHFHEFCIPDWKLEDQLESEQCWLTDHTPDLNTENAEVVSLLHGWIRHLVRKFHIDAIRVDTVKHVRKDFWPGFITAAGVAAMGEVYHGDPLYLRRYQEHSLDSILDYAMFFHLRRAFDSVNKPIEELTSMITRVHRMLPDPTLLASFLDNHDTPRFPGLVHDRALLKNAAVYPFVNDGYPIVYQGQEHGLSGGADPDNREAIWNHGFSISKQMYHVFARLNHARRRATAFPPFLTSLLWHHKLDAHTAVIAKPPLVSIFTNTGSTARVRVYYLPAMLTTYAPSMAVVDALSGQIFATDPQGGLSVPIVSGEPRVFLPLGTWEGRKVAWQHALPLHGELVMGATIEASIREPNIKHFTRLIQCAAKYGDDLCMNATSDSWELIVTNSTKSAYVCLALESAFFSRYKGSGSAAEQRRGVKCQLYAKSVLNVLGKASSVNTVERVDLKIFDPEGGLRARTDHSDEELDDDIHVASRTAHLELKLVYHHGITKKHFLHLHPSEGLRVVVDTEAQPSGFLVSARTLRDWLDHFSIAFTSSTSSSGTVRGDSHLAWQFTQNHIKIKNYETATTNVLATEVTLDVRDFSQYILEQDIGTLQLAESLGMDLDFWFSEASQPMAMTSTFLGNDRYGNETTLFKIFCALATTQTEAFSGAPPPTNGTPRDPAPVGNFAMRRSQSTMIKSERSESVASDGGQKPTTTPRRSSARPRASLTMTAEPERPPPMVTVVGAGMFPASQGVGPNDPEPLFQPGPSSQGSVMPMSQRMTQQEVLDLAGIGDLDLEAMLDDDLEDMARLADGADALDIPNDWDDIEADFNNISPQRLSTQKEDIAAAQQRASGNSSIISQRQFSLSHRGSDSDPIRPVEQSRGEASLEAESIAGTASRELSGNTSALSRLEREPNRAASNDQPLSREPSNVGRTTSRLCSHEPPSREGSRPSSRRNSTSRVDSSTQFRPDPTFFGEDETVLSDDELGPTQVSSGRVFETLFDD